MVPANIKEIFRRANEGDAEARGFLVDRENDNRLIEQFCVTPTQQKWMQDRGLTVQTMAEGRYAVGDSDIVHEMYKDWNRKLGVKWFDEEDSTQGMWDAVSKTFGELGVKSVQFGDGKPVELGGNVKERFSEEDVLDAIMESGPAVRGGHAQRIPNQNSTGKALAAETLRLIRESKERLGRR